MKKFLLATLAVLALVGCGSGKQDPLTSAISDKMAESVAQMSGGALNPADVKVAIQRIEEVGSSTLGAELDRRYDVFVTKEKVARKSYEKFSAKGMFTNAQKQLETIEKAKNFQMQVSDLKEKLAAQADSVIFRDYRFTAVATTPDGSKVEAKDYYAAVTPDFRVIAITPDTKALHRGTGSAIPGYSAIFGDEDEEPAEE